MWQIFLLVTTSSRMTEISGNISIQLSNNQLGGKSYVLYRLYNLLIHALYINHSFTNGLISIVSNIHNLLI